MLYLTYHTHNNNMNTLHHSTHITQYSFAMLYLVYHIHTLSYSTIQLCNGISCISHTYTVIQHNTALQWYILYITYIQHNTALQWYILYITYTHCHTAQYSFAMLYLVYHIYTLPYSTTQLCNSISCISHIHTAIQHNTALQCYTLYITDHTTTLHHPIVIALQIGTNKPRQLLYHSQKIKCNCLCAAVTKFSMIKNKLISSALIVLMTAVGTSELPIWTADTGNAKFSQEDC